MMNELEQLFQDTCRDYFPRWRNAPHWKIREGSRAQWGGDDGGTWLSTEAGYCDEETRTIWITPHTNLPLKVMIIHEICHAVAGKWHGQRFFNRLHQASERATALGDTTLATELQRHIELYNSEAAPYFASAPHVYTMVRDGIITTKWVADLPFNYFVDHLASELGMTPDRIHERYRRLRSVWESAQRDRAEEEAMLERFKPV